jgi:hypothetical protein
VAVGGDVSGGSVHAAVVTFNSTTVTVKAQILSNVASFNAVTCPSANLCLAVGNKSLAPTMTGAVVTVKSDKVGVPHAVSATRMPASIACGSSLSCWVTGGTSSAKGFQSQVLLVTGGVPGKILRAVGNRPGSLACVSASTCYVGDLTAKSTNAQVDKVVNGKVAAALGLPAFQGGPLTAVRCPTATSCLAAGTTAAHYAGVNASYTNAVVSLKV